MPADVRKEHSHSVRTSLKEWGTSRAVRIPKPICEQALEASLRCRAGKMIAGPSSCFALSRETPIGRLMCRTSRWMKYSLVTRGITSLVRQAGGMM